MGEFSVKPHELGLWTSAVAALTGLLTRLVTVRQARRKELPAETKETKEQREKRLEDARRIAELEERVLEARFKALEDKLSALVAAQAGRVDQLQQQNGSQARDLETFKRDLNNLWRRQRGEKPE